MAASYPSSIVALSVKNDGDTIFSSHVDALQDETIAVETGLLNGFQHIVKPFSDNTYDLGTSALAWRDAFVKRNLTHQGFAGVGALVVSNASKQIVEQAALTNGQLMIGSTGAAPVAAALTAGSGISVTNAAGSITVAATSTSALTLLKAGSGTSTSGAAVNVDTFAVTGLTANDQLLVTVYGRMTGGGNLNATAIILQNSTDGVTVATLRVGASAANESMFSHTVIGQDQAAATTVDALVMGWASTGGTQDGLTSSAFTQNWTGNWTLALRIGGMGGGTFVYRWTVHKIAGQ